MIPTNLKDQIIANLQRRINFEKMGDSPKITQALAHWETHAAMLKDKGQAPAFYRAALFLSEHQDADTFLCHARHSLLLIQDGELVGQSGGGEGFFGLLEAFKCCMERKNRQSLWKTCLAFEPLWQQMAAHTNKINEKDPEQWRRAARSEKQLKAAKNLCLIIAKIKGEHPNADLAPFRLMLEKVWKRDKGFECVLWMDIGFKPSEVLRAVSERKIRIKGDYAAAHTYLCRFPSGNLEGFIEMLGTDTLKAHIVLHLADEKLFGLIPAQWVSLRDTDRWIRNHYPDPLIWQTRESLEKSVMKEGVYYINRLHQWLSGLSYSQRKGFRENLESLSAEKVRELKEVPPLAHVLAQASGVLRDLMGF